jgi:small subunit ribosomal protein S1
MAEEQNKPTSEDAADAQPTTLDQVNPEDASAGDGATAPADTPAADTPAADADEGSLAERAAEAASNVAETVTDTVGGAAGAVASAVGSAVETVKETAKAAASGAAHAVTGAAEAVAQRIEGSSTTVDPDAPVAIAEPEKLQPKGGTLGFKGEIQGKVITLAELKDYENRKDPDTPEERDEDFLAMIEGSMNIVDEGEIVRGRVVAVGPKEVLIDFGFKSTGAIAKNEFEEVLEVGDEVDVYLERKEDRLGQPVISKQMADTVRRWQTIEQAFENEGVIEGTIVRRIKGGMIVDLLGAEAFLPGSQVDVRPVRDFDAYLGRTMEFKVVKTNPTNGNVVVSHKALVEKDLQAQREKILDTMEVGQILEGQVKNIVDFGVFIDLGGVDGLLHITDLSWGRVGHPSEVIELDQKLNVVVLNYEKERQRISLGLKQLLSHPWENIEEKYVEGQSVQGRVVSITDYGAFVELEKGIEGLVHISEMSYTEHVKHPTQKVQLGQMVEVKILNVDTDEKKISLGMKQLESDPWEGLLDRVTVGYTTTGKVRNITSFGAFVELEPGIDGLVHVSDLSWTKRIKHPSEVVRKGQDLEIIVLDIDVAQRRLSLGHKQVQTDPWQQYATAYAEDTDTTAKIVEITPEGIRVELPLEAPGFIPASQLERGNTNAYQEGEELSLRVIRLDRQERDIILSETALRRAAERAERNAERAQKTAEIQAERKQVSEYQSQEGSRGPATLGELSGLEALKAKLEAQEAHAEAQGVNAPSESDSKAVQAAQPEEQDPIQTEGSASTAIEDQVGMGNSGPIGKDPREQADTGRLEHPTEPPANRRRRTEDAGEYPPAEGSQAALKGAGAGEEHEGIAGQVEDSTDDQTPGYASSSGPDFSGPDVETPADVKVADELKRPAGDAAPEGDADRELGKASAKVTGGDEE